MPWPNLRAMALLGTVAIAGWLVLLTVCDVRAHRLPNVLTVGGAVTIMAIGLLAGRGLGAAVGSVALAGGYLVVHLCAPHGMGAGDVKLALGLGALTGAFGVAPWALAAVGAPVLTVCLALLTRRRVVPHGPAMCLATALALGCALG